MRVKQNKGYDGYVNKNILNVINFNVYFLNVFVLFDNLFW